LQAIICFYFHEHIIYLRKDLQSFFQKQQHCLSCVTLKVFLHAVLNYNLQETCTIVCRVDVNTCARKWNFFVYNY